MWPEYTIDWKIAGEGDVTVEKRTKAFFSFTSGLGLSTMPLKGRVSENFFYSMVLLPQASNVIGRKIAAIAWLLLERILRGVSISKLL